jgi:hypothetical protein
MKKPGPRARFASRRPRHQLRSVRAERVLDLAVSLRVLLVVPAAREPLVVLVEVSVLLLPIPALEPVPAPLVEPVPVPVVELAPAVSDPVVEPVEPVVPVELGEPVAPVAPVPAPLILPAGLFGSVMVPGVPAMGFWSVPEPLGPEELPPWLVPPVVPASELPAVPDEVPPWPAEVPAPEVLPDVWA